MVNPIERSTIRAGNGSAFNFSCLSESGSDLDSDVPFQMTVLDFSQMNTFNLGPMNKRVQVKGQFFSLLSCKAD